jgi:hypothetical protein
MVAGIISVVVILGIAYFITSCVTSSDEANIKAFYSKRSEKILTSERRMLSRGPYWWAHQNCRIYKVQTDKGLYWHYFNIQSEVKQELPGGEYKKIE